MTPLYPRGIVLSRALIAGVFALAVASPAFAADPLRDEQWNLEMVNGPQAWPTSTGVGAVVAVIDTGVRFNHPDLSGRFHPDDFDFVGADVDDPDTDGDPADGDGHGTHVTGIIAANRDNGEGIAGVAPGARVLPLRVLDDNGGGYVEDTIKAINYAIDKRVHVINLSLGDYVPLYSTLFGDDPAYADALERAVRAGIVVVVAAGNNGVPKCENPDVAGMVCVGAVDNSGNRAPYSSHGSNVDLMAPGGSIGVFTDDYVLSTYLGGEEPDYEYISGTSQAAPHVAGVAALLASLGVRGQAAADRIVATAADAGASGPDDQYGAGIVDAAAAVAGLAVDPGDPDAVGSFATKRRVKRRAVRRRGFRVTCTAARPGECAVVVRRRGRVIARGGADVPAQIGTVVTAELNRRGRRALRRMGRRLRARVVVTLPGETARTQRVKIRR